MIYPDPEPTTDVDSLLGALHRADQNWPNRGDLERYWEEHAYSRPFQSVEEAELAVQKLHERDSAESRISQIGWHVREKAVEEFLKAHAKTTDSTEINSTQRAIKQLMLTSSFNKLEGLLRDIQENGVAQALKRYRSVDRGNKYGHIFAGFLALLEIVVFLLVLSACEHGFQTIVVCALGFIYTAVSYQGYVLADLNLKHFAALLEETSRLKYLLKDRGFQRSEAEDSFETLNSTFAKNQVRFWITVAKTSIISLICLAGLVTSLL